MPKNLSIVFVRRGYSSTGGAEAYLKHQARDSRLANGQRRNRQSLWLSDKQDRHCSQRGPSGEISVWPGASRKVARGIEFEARPNRTVICWLWMGTQGAAFCYRGGGALQGSQDPAARCRSRNCKALQDEAPAFLARRAGAISR